MFRCGDEGGDCERRWRHCDGDPMDCKVLPTIPGICTPKKCMEDCQGGIGRSSVGECVSDGCQCTYCTIPPRGRRN
ncbi:hypothetical protein CFC21_054544 [Triticum aestivum]|uniref:Uncharacterized protein n=2 Tax=Triticum aestivum TaxID=4565 RepID=A0A3B6I1X6_WHEAT|nr:hypothetical protein CFC21_054544 [Triticum aestivum]